VFRIQESAYFLKPALLHLKMADLKIIEYTGPAKCKLQKPSSNNNRQPSCLNSNLRKIAGKMLSEALPTVGGGTGDKGCYQKTAAKDREDIPQSSNDYLIRDQRKFEIYLSDCFVQSNGARLTQ